MAYSVLPMIGTSLLAKSRIKGIFDIKIVLGADAGFAVKEKIKQCRRENA